MLHFVGIFGVGQESHLAWAGVFHTREAMDLHVRVAVQDRSEALSYFTEFHVSTLLVCDTRRGGSLDVCSPARSPICSGGTTTWAGNGGLVERGPGQACKSTLPKIAGFIELMANALPQQLDRYRQPVRIEAHELNVGDASFNIEESAGSSHSMAS